MNFSHMSPIGMFLGADMIVKTVMIGLGLASVATWTIWLVKGLELLSARRSARTGRDALRAAPDLESAVAALQMQPGAATQLANAAWREWGCSAGPDAEGVKERVVIALAQIEAAAANAVARGSSVLATIGSTAPFVGLFGTVWGIMNAFIGISETKTTNLAVVAPGIAEALLATGMGLFAAIPAVVLYNAFTRSLAAYRRTLSDVSGDVLVHLSRDLDRMKGSNAQVRRLRPVHEA